MHNIGFGSLLSDTRSAENDLIGADTDPEYRIDASLHQIHKIMLFLATSYDSFKYASDYR